MLFRNRSNDTKKKSVLITCDKFIIANEQFRNKFVYYDTASFKNGRLNIIKEFYELTHVEMS